MIPGDDASGSVSGMLRRVSAGDDQAADELWKLCFPRIVAIAQRSLNHLAYRHADAEDAAQSAFISFWRKLALGSQAMNLDRNSMWNLLATITIRKTNRQLRREGAQKRGSGDVRNESSLLAEESGRRTLDDMLGKVSTGDFDLACEEWLMMLEEGLKPYAILRVLGNSNAEIASVMEVRERTVERKLNLIRDIWTVELQKIDDEC